MKLQELWPEAKGTSRVSITEFLSENPNLDFSTKIDLRLPAEEIAKRLGLPEGGIKGQGPMALNLSVNRASCNHRTFL